MKMDFAHNDATARMVVLFLHLYADLDELIVDDLRFHSQNLLIIFLGHRLLIGLG